MLHDTSHNTPAAPASSGSDCGEFRGEVSQRRRKLLFAVATAPALAVPAIASGQTSDGARATSAPMGPGAGTRTTPYKRRKVPVMIGGSTGIGISYLPLTVMVKTGLLEKHAASFGIDVSPQWVRFPRAAAMYDALTTGTLDFASGGVSQLLTSWDRTRTTVQIKGVGSLVSMPIYLVSSNPDVKTVADFTSKDRIAVPEVRTSIQAVTLAMAAEKAFGRGQGDRLDPLTVAMGHPDAMKALLGHLSGIDAHFSAAPLMYQELENPGVHKVLDSYDVLGGPHTYNAVWTSARFRDANPAIYTAFVSALQEAHNQINADPAAAAALWLKAEDVRNMSASQVEAIIRKPENEWSAIPRKFEAFATFMNRSGLLSTKPSDWRSFFFDNAKDFRGD